MNAPWLIEADHSSLFLSWDHIRNASLFELEMSDDNGDSWTSLSNRISGYLIRKKHLIQGKQYLFRIRYLDESTNVWSEYSSNSEIMNVLSGEIQQIHPPRMKNHDHFSITLAWDTVSGADGYSLRYRTDEPGDKWKYVESVIANTFAKKKNLESGRSYFFSIKPIHKQLSFEYSLSSESLSVAILSSFIRDLFPSKLLSKSGSVQTSEALPGKLVAVYFSAHW